MIERGISEEQLIEIGRIDTSSHPFVIQVREVLPALNQRMEQRLAGQVEAREDSVEVDLRRISSVLLWSNHHKGFGYMAPSLNNSVEDEVLATALVNSYFREGKMGTEPLVIPIDIFYSYYPGQLSLVGKVGMFNEQVGEEGRFSLILTDFSGSKIFTDDTLNKIPNQDEIGLSFFKNGDELAQMIMDTSRYKIDEIFIQEKSIEGVLLRLSGTDNSESARLLLVTTLLLSDRQTWQNLWYESREKGTPLYIIAPAIFHHAMNRLNLSWGHGGCDYQYRASCSLGAFDEPLFDREVRIPKYHEIGLSKAEFRRIVEPLLVNLRSN